MIPGVVVINHTPVCKILTCSSAHNSADVIFTYVIQSTTNGVSSSPLWPKQGFLNSDPDSMTLEIVTQLTIVNSEQQWTWHIPKINMPKNLGIIKRRGLLHKQKGGHLPLLIQAQIKTSPESVHERIIWASTEFGIGRVRWAKATADERKWAITLVVIYLLQKHKYTPLTDFITWIPGKCDESYQCVEVLMCVRESPGRRAVASDPLKGGWELALGMPACCLGLWGTWELQNVWQRGRAKLGETGREV